MSSKQEGYVAGEKVAKKEDIAVEEVKVKLYSSGKYDEKLTYRLRDDLWRKYCGHEFEDWGHDAGYRFRRNR